MKKILVIGESCKDIFIEGEVVRLNPESPCLILDSPFKRKENSGCAGNTVENFRSLQPDWQTYFLCQSEPLKKVRYIESKTGQTLLRVDEIDRIDQFLKHERFEKNAQELKPDAVVISDYCKGFLGESILSSIFKSCNLKSIPVFMDTRKILGSWSKQCDFVKINEKEFLDNKKNAMGDPMNLCKNLIVTLGEDGSKWMVPFKRNLHKRANKIELNNPSGAGDTFLAAFVCAYLMKKTPENCLYFANKAAGLACSQRNVVSVDGKEIWE